MTAPGNQHQPVVGPFSGQPSSAPCPKCGSDSAHTQWCSSRAGLTEEGTIDWSSYPQNDSEPGWLVRWCERCGYPRAEGVVEAQ